MILFDYLSIPFLISNFIVVLGFVLSAWFAWKYTKTFYEGRERPKSWLLIIFGLSIMVVSEIGQFLLPYWSDPTILMGSTILLIQNAAVILIASGCYLLFKEVP